MTGTGGGPRSPRRPLPTVVLVVVALLVTGLVRWGSTDLAASPAAEAGRAGRFVPADGVRSVHRDADGVSVTESARTTGAVLALSSPAGVVGALGQELGTQGLAALSVWRTTRTPYDPPDGTRQTTTVRSVSSAGIEQLATWGTVTLVFTPALLEVPAAVRAGSTWSGKGTARPDGSIRYDASFRAAAVTGRADCLRVTGTIAFTEKDGTLLTRSPSDETWCDGAGVVTTGDTTTTSPAFDGPVDVPRAVLGDVSRWRATAVPAARVDDTFGASPFQAQVDVAPVRLEDFTLVLPDRSAGDLVGLQRPDTDLVASWVAHPGGTVTTLAALGSVSLVGTTDRTLTAYGPDGALRWTRRFRDVPLTQPVDVGGGRVAVTTLDGTVTVLDVATGHDVWSTTLPAEVRVAPTTDGRRLVVADRSGVVRALDLATGHVLWSVRGDAVDAMALVDGVLVVVDVDGAARGLALADGGDLWIRFVDGATTAVVAVGAVAVVVTSEHTLGIVPANGRVRWDQPGSRTVAGLGADPGDLAAGAQVLVAVDDGRLVALDDSGRAVARWSASGLQSPSLTAWFLVPSATGFDVVDGLGHVVRVAT